MIADRQQIRPKDLFGMVLLTAVLASSGCSQTDPCSQGLEFLRFGDYEKAIDQFDKALELNPSDPEALFGRAVAREELGDLEKAVVDFGKAISAGKEGLKRLEKAPLEDEQRQAQSKKTIRGLAEAHYRRGLAFSAKQARVEAADDFTEAIRLQPGHGRAHYNRAILYQKQGKSNEAVADFSEALKLGYKHAEAYYGRGFCLLETGFPAIALGDFAEAIRLNAKHVEAYCQRGRAYLETGNLSRAIESCQQAIRLDATDSEAYFIWLFRRIRG